jgi:hypothetical protein
VRVREEDIEPVAVPQKRVVDMTPEELRAHIMRPLTPEEAERRGRWAAELPKLQRTIDINTATLKRVGRRMNEVLYGERTLEELIHEES